MTLLALLAAVGAATGFGVASPLQHRAAGRAPTGGALNPSLLIRLARDASWLTAGGIDVVAIALQTAALRYAPVLVVQPIIVLGLPIAVLLRPVLDGHAPAAHAVVAATGCALGVAVFILGAHPTPAPVTAAALRPGPLAVPAAVAAPVAAGAGIRRTRLTATVVAASAGVLLGDGAVLLRVVAASLGTVPVQRLATAFALLLAVGVLGLVTTQAAFQRGTMPLPLAVLTLVEPLAASALAIAVIDERIELSWSRGAGIGAGITLAVVGVAALAAWQD